MITDKHGKDGEADQKDSKGGGAHEKPGTDKGSGSNGNSAKGGK
jgi:hypothetical protein